MLGHTQKLGHAGEKSIYCFRKLLPEYEIFLDFYPNNGKPRQPGCLFPSDIVGSCSHGRSIQFFAESIETKTGFMAIECDTWEDYISKSCIGDLIPMGFLTPSTARGMFFLQTGEGPKFARYQKINY